MIHRRSIVYNIQWCGIIYVCTYTRVTHTGVLWCTYEYMQYSEKRNPQIFRGLRPLDPRQGLMPLHPARGPKAGPWTPHKIGSRLRARYVRSAHMFASPKKIGSRLRARYVRSAHMFAPQKKSARAYALAMCAERTLLPKKNRTPAIQKNRLALRARSLMRYAHMSCPPIINRCPLLAPPLFNILVPPLPTRPLQLDLTLLI